MIAVRMRTHYRANVLATNSGIKRKQVLRIVGTRIDNRTSVPQSDHVTLRAGVGVW